jgi:hypothetical protein
MSDSNSPSWKQLYVEALRETDKKRLAELAYVAEEAIFFRLGQLEGSADHREEQSELKAACAVLLTTRVAKLGWPAPFV